MIKILPVRIRCRLTSLYFLWSHLVCLATQIKDEVTILNIACYEEISGVRKSQYRLPYQFLRYGLKYKSSHGWINTHQRNVTNSYCYDLGRAANGGILDQNNTSSTSLMRDSWTTAILVRTISEILTIVWFKSKNNGFPKFRNNSYLTYISKFNSTFWLRI